MIVLYFILAIFYKRKINLKRVVNKILTLIIIMMYVISLINIFVPRLTSNNIEVNINQSYDLSEYSHVLIKFQEENWNNIGIKEKELAINELVQIEMIYLLGELDKALKVTLNDIENQSLYGYYTYKDDMITLNTNALSNRLITIFVVLHECYHRYQYELINVLEDKMNTHFMMMREVKQWKEEYENYISASQNYEKYYNQHLEKSAREYAKERIYVYLNLIDGDNNNGKEN